MDCKPTISVSDWTLTPPFLKLSQSDLVNCMTQIFQTSFGNSLVYTGKIISHTRNLLWDQQPYCVFTTDAGSD